MDARHTVRGTLAELQRGGYPPEFGSATGADGIRPAWRGRGTVRAEVLTRNSDGEYVRVGIARQNDGGTR